MTPSRISLRVFGFALAAAVSVSAAAGAQGAASAASPAASAPSAVDAAFVAAATLDANTELVLGQLAKTKATRAPLRELGDRIAREHRRTVDELTIVALARGITPPPHLDTAHQQAVDSLAKTNGPAFDRVFLLQTIEDLTRTLATYRRQASRGHDAGLVAHARQALPMLESQLKTARALAATVK